MQNETRHRLHQGDCLEVMRSLPDQSVDMCLTDPPFGTTQCQWDVVIPFEPMWAELKRIVKPNGAILLFGCEPFSSHLRLSNLKMFKYDWVYEKTEAKGHLNAKKRPLSAHEIVSVFYSRPPSYSPQKTTGHPRKVALGVNRANKLSDLYGDQKTITNYDSTERYPRSVLKFKTDKQKDNFHPTQKPVALLEYLIKTYTHENETVLDFTAGSFSTGVASINTNRFFIGIEKENKYYQIGIERIAKALRERQNAQL